MINPTKKTLPIFHAGSLTAAFAKMNAEFQKSHPDIEIQSQAAGSVDAVRWVTEQKKPCGILASADYGLIPRMMLPVYADWYIIFASDEMVISYSDKSKYYGEINANNWYEILQREGVTYSLQNPNGDPGGYRTLMVWQLAGMYYRIPELYDKLRNSPGCKILPQKEQIDYSFSYRSGTVRNNTKFVTLPETINLSSNKFGNYYAQARVEIKNEVSGNTIILGGEPILFGLTIPKNFPNQEIAESWIKLLLGETGASIMKSSGMNPLRPTIADNNRNLPKSIRDFLNQGEI